MEPLYVIRQAEAQSHTEAYTNHDLYTAGSWLAKPVKTVLDLLPMFEGRTDFRALDLGSGVGRNSIPVARFFAHIPCRVDCVDILELAIDKLRENAVRFGVSEAIAGVVSSIDAYSIPGSHYDLIMAVSALEHVDSKETFLRKLGQIRDGIRPGGIVCLIINSGIQEHDKATGRELVAQFEVNLRTEEMQEILTGTFARWQTIKHTVVHQKYEITRKSGIAELETNVITCVVRK